MSVLPSSLALTTIADGANIVASDHRNNYSAIQTEANALLNVLNVGTAGDVLGGVGTTLTFSKPPGYAIGYSPLTATVNVVGTTEGAATAVIAGSSIAYDGSPIWLEFWTYAVDTGGGTLQMAFYDGATSLGSFGPQVAGTYYPQPARLRVAAPTVANHTYNVKAWVTSGTGHVYAGAGGAGNALPGYLRIVKE